MYRSSSVTGAVIAALRAAGLQVGDGERPNDPAQPVGWQGAPGVSPFVGYVVVHPIAGGTVDGTLGEPNTDFAPLYQLSSYGANRAQAETIGDLARNAVLTAQMAVTGRVVVLVAIDLLGGCRRTDDVQPPVWQAVDRIRVLTVAPTRPWPPT